MADEHGNIECGIEVLTMDSIDLPQVQTLDVVYYYFINGPQTEGMEIPMERETEIVIPAGYHIAGLVSCRLTRTHYDADPAATSKKTSTAPAINADEDTEIMQAIRNGRVPASFVGICSVTSSVTSRRHFEVTLTVILAPVGSPLVPELGTVEDEEEEEVN